MERNKISIGIINLNHLNEQITKHKNAVTDLEDAVDNASSKKEAKRFNAQLGRAEKKLDDFLEETNKNLQMAKVIIKDTIEEHVITSLHSSINHFATIYSSPVNNPHELDNLPALFGLIKALESQYRPDIELSVAASVQKVISLPNNSTLQQMVDAVHQHIRELSYFPILDNNGNEIIDPITNRPECHKINPTTLKAKLIHFLNDPKDITKSVINSIYMQKNNISFQELFNSIEQNAIREKSANLPQPPIPTVTSAPINNIVPTITQPQQTSQPTITPTPSAPAIANNANAQPSMPRCSNCNRSGHKTRQCRNRRCGVCHEIFDSPEQRNDHFDTAHRHNRNKRFEHERQSFYRSDRRQQHEKYQGSGKPHSRENSQSRDYYSSSEASSSQGKGKYRRPRTPSPSPKRYRNSNRNRSG